MIHLLTILLSCLIFRGHSLSYYVSNSSDFINESNCTIDGESLSPCVTLGMLASQELTDKNSLTITFIHQTYSIYESIELVVRAYNGQVEIKPWKKGTRVSINCIEDFSFRVTYNIHLVTVQNIRFTDCGKNYPVLKLESCQYSPKFNYPVIEILHAEFIGTLRCSIMLMLNCSKSINFIVQNSIFKHGKGESIWIHSNNTKFQLSHTTFTNNSQGSVYFKSSGTLQIESCLFVKNMIPFGRGSAIFISFSDNVTINNSTFLNNINTAIAVESALQVIVVNNSNFTGNIGHSGGVFYFTYASDITLYNSNFKNNQASKEGGVITGCKESGQQCTWNIISVNCKYIANLVLKGSGGVFNVQNCNEVIMNMTDTTYVNNTAIVGGAIALSNSGSVLLQLKNVKFVRNRASFGGVIRAFSVRVFKTEGGSFMNSSSTYDGGAIYLYNSGDIDIKFSNFNNNVGGNGGVLNIEYNGQVEVSKYTLSHCTFVGNKASKGGAIYLRRVEISMIFCDFLSNTASSGGALFLEGATVNLTKFQSYSNSAEQHGGSITATQSQLFITDNAQFNNDKVTSPSGSGGAIYIENTANDCNNDSSCFIHWSRNSTINFTNTSAVRGHIIFGGMIDRCAAIQSRTDVINAISFNNGRYDIHSHGISSQPLQLCICKDNITNCQLRSTSIKVIPGKTFYVEVACVDQMKQIVSCDIRAEYLQTKVQLGQGQSLRHIGGCTNLSFNAFSVNVTHTVLQLMGGLCSYDMQNTLKFDLKIHSCPKGFENIHRKCQCDQRLVEFSSNVHCDIESSLITITEGWFGFVGDYLGVSTNCPLKYCKNSYYYNVNSFYRYTYSRCSQYRRGILCGQCFPNHSVILGSSECWNCSNISQYNFIWLVILIALAGIVLLVFLMLTKMTVSCGTVNGLILYANLVSFSGLLDQYDSHGILRVILSWINLDLGIEVCFYPEMDVYQKTWLQFVFPFYVWFLVIIIILLCHYSPRVMKLMGMRNIEVLATPFLLSYTKLLKTILIVFSFTDISVANSTNTFDPLVSHRVWLYDGNIEYLGSKHLPLFIVASLFLVFLFLPYTLLLVFGQCLRSLPRRKGLQWVHSTVVSSVLDAYHAPYSKRHRYWTGLGLMLRCILFIIFSTSYDIRSNIFWLTVGSVIILSYRQLFCNKIYQSKFSDRLEVFYLTNLTIMSATLLFSGFTYIYIVFISSALAVMAFIVTFVYHVVLVVKGNSAISRYFKNCRLKVKQDSSIAEESIPKLVPASSSSTFELRESLLEN